jgi:hypothetical protein
MQYRSISVCSTSFFLSSGPKYRDYMLSGFNVEVQEDNILGFLVLQVLALNLQILLWLLKRNHA